MNPHCASCEPGSAAPAQPPTMASSSHGQAERAMNSGYVKPALPPSHLCCSTQRTHALTNTSDPPPSPVYLQRPARALAQAVSLRCITHGLSKLCQSDAREGKHAGLIALGSFRGVHLSRLWPAKTLHASSGERQSLFCARQSDVTCVPRLVFVLCVAAIRAVSTSRFSLITVVSRTYGTYGSGASLRACSVSCVFKMINPSLYAFL